ncbi:MAG: GNAT family N-acetyltransferase [Candidatus Thorarchaeota archaeon]
MSEAPIIRCMTLDDLDRFLKLHKDDDPEDTLNKEQFCRRVESQSFFGLFLDKSLIGNLNLLPFNNHEGHFQGIFIASEYRGRGYGNLLLEHALNWYREHGIRKAHLYTHKTNEIAQNLYKKHGFEISSEAYHFIVPFDSLTPQDKFTCEEIQEEDIDAVEARFSEVFPTAHIRRYLSSERDHVIVLKYRNGELAGVCRFLPSFPGCFPFVIDKVDAFDDFLTGIKPFSSSEFDYSRVTFFGLPELARLCKERGYELHHEMYRMTVQIPSEIKSR